MFLRPAATGVFIVLASAQAAEPLEEAKRAFDAQEYAEAARLFETARQREPACETSLYLGLTRYRLQQKDAAVVAFQEAAKCDPKLAMAYLALAEAYVERGNDEKALAAYDRVLSLDPRNATALRAAATLHTKGKHSEKAALLLERLVKQEPNNAPSHADLGAAYFNIGNQEGAEREIRQALKLNPQLASALLVQANLLLRSGKEEQAIEQLREVVRLAPTAFEPRFLLGATYNRLNRFAEAASELKAAVRLGGTEPEIYYHLARAYGSLGHSEERSAALAKFNQLKGQEKADTENGRQALKLVEQAKSLVESGDLRAALAPTEQAHNLRPQDDSILFRLASLNYDLAQYDKAREAIQQAIALAPSEWVYHLLLGLSEGRAGRFQEARTSLEVAVRLNPSADAHNALGEVALRQGDKIAAEINFRKASTLDPAKELYRVNLETARKATPK